MDFKLGINIDHIATLRNARNEGSPDLLKLTQIVIAGGADLITAHLREDRRHIKDADLYALRDQINIPLNMELAPTEEMIHIASLIKPSQVCFVPEARNEITTEGGLDVVSLFSYMKDCVSYLKGLGIAVYLFIDPILSQLEASSNLGADGVEINTGTYSNNTDQFNIDTIIQVAKAGMHYDLNVHAGHGLNLYNLDKIVAIGEITEFNIGHFIIAYALEVGIKNSVKATKEKIHSIRYAL